MKKVMLIVVMVAVVMVGCSDVEKKLVTPVVQEEEKIIGAPQEDVTNSEVEEIVIDVDEGNIYETLKNVADEHNLKYFEYVENFVDLPKYSLVFVSKYCEACTYFAPTVLQYINSEGTNPMFMVSLDDESTHEFAKSLDINETPTTLVIVDGEIVEKIVGIVDIDELINRADY